MSNLVNVICKIPKAVCGRLLRRLGKYLSDEQYIRIVWRLMKGKRLDLENAKSYNEKLQWLKLNYRVPVMTELVDKDKVKDYVRKVIGEEYVIPTYGVWNNFDDIEWDKLPKQFVMKCNHDSGGNIICKDKTALDYDKARRKIEKCLKRNYYYAGREWAYKNVSPKILAEMYLEDKSGDLKDYKIFVFNGTARLIQVDYDRYTEHKRNLYTTQWEYINASIQYPSHPEIKIAKPEKLDEMIRIAEQLAKPFPHARVDLYLVNSSIYFGEITFYHGSGMEKITPQQLNDEMGGWLDISELKK